MSCGERIHIQIPALRLNGSIFVVDSPPPRASVSSSAERDHHYATGFSED